MQLISYPSLKIISIIAPTCLLFTMCGFITKHEQLLNRAVVWNGDFNPKKRSNSIFAKLSI